MSSFVFRVVLMIFHVLSCSLVCALMVCQVLLVLLMHFDCPVYVFHVLCVSMMIYLVSLSSYNCLSFALPFFHVIVGLSLCSVDFLSFYSYASIVCTLSLSLSLSLFLYDVLSFVLLFMYIYSVMVSHLLDVLESCCCC